MLQQYFKYYELENVTFHYEPVLETFSASAQSMIKVSFGFKGTRFETFMHRFMPPGSRGIKVTLVSMYGKEVNHIRPLYYQGKVANTSASFVHGTVVNNTFTGSVHIFPRIIYIEHLCNFMEEECHGTESLIYEVKDIIVNTTIKRGMEYLTKRPVIKGQSNDKR